MADRSQQQPHQHSPAAARAAQAAQITGFRIMRKFEIAPGWWGQPREVGDNFCREQNAVTLNPNRSKRIEYYAEPVCADAGAPIPPAMSPADITAHTAASYVRPNPATAWDDDDNKPVIPKIPNPRKPRVFAFAGGAR
jgi:hypothetical protein